MSKVFRNKSEKINVYAPGVIRKGNSVSPHQTSNATLHWSFTFSRALGCCSFLVLTVSSDWLFVTFYLVLIGSCGYFLSFEVHCVRLLVGKASVRK